MASTKNAKRLNEIKLKPSESLKYKISTATINEKISDVLFRYEENNIVQSYMEIQDSLKSIQKIMKSMAENFEMCKNKKGFSATTKKRFDKRIAELTNERNKITNNIDTLEYLYKSAKSREVANAAIQDTVKAQIEESKAELAALKRQIDSNAEGIANISSIYSGNLNL